MTAARICGDILEVLNVIIGNVLQCSIVEFPVQSMITERRLTISSNSSRTMHSVNFVGMSYYQTEPLLMRSFLLVDTIANSDVTDMKTFLFYHSS